MKWSHSATTKSWLVSEWQAATDALDEAFVLGFATASHVPGELKLCRDPGRTKKQCRFCEEVQIFFGLEDEIKSSQLQFRMNFSTDGRTNLGDYVHQVPGKAPRMIVLW